MIVSILDVRVQAVYGIEVKHAPVFPVLYIYNRAACKRFGNIIAAKAVCKHEGVFCYVSTCGLCAMPIKTYRF